MATTTEKQATRVIPSSEILRRNVVDQLARLPDEGVAVLHDLAQELELRAAWAEFSSGITKDWAAGKLEGLEDAIAAARKSLRQSRGQ
jgi:hypothetical protein